MNQRARFDTFALNPLKIAALAFLVGSAACASAPPDEISIQETTMETASVEGFGQEVIRRDRLAETKTIAVSTDLVWGVLGGVYERIGIPVTAVDSKTLTVGNLGYEARRIDGSRMNTYVDCGTNFGGPLANTYEVTLSVVTKLAKVDERHTEVSTTVDASAKPRTVAGYPVQCTTRQKLEELIIKKVAEVLGLEG